MLRQSDFVKYKVVYQHSAGGGKPNGSGKPKKPAAPPPLDWNGVLAKVNSDDANGVPKADFAKALLGTDKLVDAREVQEKLYLMFAEPNDPPVDPDANTEAGKLAKFYASALAETSMRIDPKSNGITADKYNSGQALIDPKNPQVLDALDAFMDDGINQNGTITKLDIANAKNYYMADNTKHHHRIFMKKRVGKLSPTIADRIDVQKEEYKPPVSDSDYDNTVTRYDDDRGRSDGRRSYNRNSDDYWEKRFKDPKEFENGGNPYEEYRQERYGNTYSSSNRYDRDIGDYTCGYPRDWDNIGQNIGERIVYGVLDNIFRGRDRYS